MTDSRALYVLLTASLMVVAGVLCGCDGGKSSSTAGEHHRERDDHEDHENERHDHEGHADHDDEAHSRKHGEGSTKGHAGEKVVHLDDDALQSAGIEIGEADAGVLRDNVSVTASVKHDVSRVAHISPLVEGQIVDVKASIGDTVESGDVVAVMHSVELGKARAAVAEAKAALDVAETNFERQKRLRDKGIASERAFIEARGALSEAKARYDGARSRLRTLGVSSGSGPRYPLRGRIDGTIIEQHASVGETKGPHDELFVVADQSEVWVVGQVPEQDIHRVRKGMEAVVTMQAYPERTWEGTVDWISSTVDSDTRLLPIRVELENEEGHLRPGMFGTIRISADEGQNELAIVSVDAVQRMSGGSVVFVPGEEKGAFRAQPVSLGAEAGGKVEVVRGLKPGDRFVEEGAFDVKAAMTASGRSAAHHH